MEELIEKHPRCAGLNNDKVYYVCNAIYSESAKLDPATLQHSFKKDKYFVPLRSKILEQFLGTIYYRNILIWMCNAGIIETDNSWDSGIVSRGYA